MADREVCKSCGRTYDEFESHRAGTRNNSDYCSPKCENDARAGGYGEQSSSSSSSSGGCGGAIGTIFGIIMIGAFLLTVSSSNYKPSSPSSSTSNPTTTQTNTEQPLLSEENSTSNNTEETPISTITQPSPADAVSDYYSLINSKDYSSGWNKLSPQSRNNKNKHPNGYESYTDWWTKVAYIDVLDTTVISQDSETAIVESRLKYTMDSNGKTVNQSLRFHFIWDESSGSWLIDQTDKM